MTVPDAQKFVARWRRILIPWAARTEAEAVRDMERSCVGICGGMSLLVIISIRSTWSASAAISSIAFIVGLLSFWLVLQFRAVRRALEGAGVQSR